jgi:hypothetical protein
MAEYFIEHLRIETRRPPTAVAFNGHVVVSADDQEVNLLATWQLLCGQCDRLDLVKNTTTKEWRGRFADLDTWFQRNRPFILWDNSGSHIRIDEDAREGENVTMRESRLIPELKPTWPVPPPP